MADATSSSSGGVDDVDVEDQSQMSKESKQLDAVTDFAEEEEMDMSKAQAVLNNLTASGETEEQQKLARELAAVVVKQEDIDLLSAELEISADDAEQKIRQARGDVKLAITNAIAL